ncbi:MAG: DUF2442 domain-containing protein [Fusobacteriaceae bacterium]|jgi:hypothetical protein|nr:DUF2442 domain-containing protein [Fusobacteriaceae bacterium]
MESYYPVHVEALPDYKLRITFDNNERREFDVKPYLSDAYFSSLKNVSLFRMVRINPITVEWPGRYPQIVPKKV